MAILDFAGAYGSDVRPARSGADRKPWTKDPSVPGGNDGTRIDATLANDIVAMFRALATAYGLANSANDDLIVDAMAAALETKLGPSDVVNSLTSTASDRPLAAAMGKTLMDAIAGLGDVIVVADLTAAAALTGLDSGDIIHVSDGGSGKWTRYQVTSPGDGTWAGSTRVVYWTQDQAPASHGHVIADVTGLQTAIDGKSDTGHGHGNATTSAAGFMSAADKTNLDGLVASAIPVGSSIMWNMSVPPAGFLEENGAAVSRTTYAALFAVLVRSATCTITIASPGDVTWTNHGLSASDPVKFSTTGALPTGLVAGTTYYVIASGLTANTFRVAATPSGAAINTSGSQSGTHTVIHAPHGTGDGATTFNLPDSRGEFVRGWDHGAGVDANRVMGSTQDDATAVNGLSASTTATNNTTSLQPNTGGAFDLSRGPAPGAVSLASTDPETRPRNRAKMFCIKF